MHIRKCTNDDPTLEGLKSAIEEMRNPQDKLASQCMVVLLLAIAVGADVDRLTEETGYPRDFIEAISSRMRKAGLWIGELADDREWRDADGNLTSGFFAHALVAQGQYVRERTRAGGCRYISSKTGHIIREWNPHDQ
jgi:hypothetical protein